MTAEEAPPDFSDVEGGSSSTAPATGKTYTIVKGDTLSKIAREEYGESKLWRKDVRAHVSVDTTGVGKATVVKAKWTFTDKKGNAVPVHEEARTVDLDGPATHEFHVSKKTPWPKGAYNVEILLNDVPAAKKGFSVN